MVRSSGRFTAVWITIIMSTSGLLALQPIAEAGHGTSTSPNVMILSQNPAAPGWKNYDPADPYTPDSIISVGDTVRFFWDITWPAPPSGTCQTSAVSTGRWGVLAPPANVQVEATGILTTAAAGPPTLRQLVNDFTLHVEHEITATAVTAGTGESASASIKLAVIFTCVDSNGAAGTLPETETQTFQSKTFRVDTIRPAFSPGTVATLEHDATQRQFDGATPIGTATVASIGTKIKFTPTFTVVNAGEFMEVNYEDLVTGSTWTTITAGTQQTLTVQEGVPVVGDPGWKKIQGTAPAIKVRATDAAGNVATVQNVAPGAALTGIDNVRPSPAVWGTSPSNLTRQASAATLDLWWQAEADIVATAVTINGVARGFMHRDITVPVENHRIFPTAELGLSDPLTSALTVVIYPIDTAGNINTSASLARSPAFPSGIAVSWGGVQGIPVSVKGSEFGNIYLNVTDNGPTALPYSNADARVVFGEIMRFRNAAESFWRNGTAGSDLTINNADTAGAGHFTDTSQPDTTPPGAPPANYRTTAFQPAHNAPVNFTGTGGTVRSYTLANASGRNFADGLYQMRLSLTAPSGDKTMLQIPFSVDSRVPTVPNTHPVYSNLGLGANMTGANAGGPSNPNHGSDGNPVRVVFLAQDAHTQTSSGREDSGLKKVKLEFIDTLTWQVAKRGNGQEAKIEITPATCHDVLSYCVSLPAANPGGTCSTATPTMADMDNGSIEEQRCAWQEIITNDRKNTTYGNLTTFSGWFNTTFPDLPVGKYLINVTATDNAGLTTVKSYATLTDPYKVAPLVRVFTGADSPRVNEDRTISVVGLASQRFVTPPASAAAMCGVGPAGITADVCPASLVRVYVSNTNGIADAGTVLDYSLRDAAVSDPAQEFTKNGWTGINTLNGTLEFKDGLKFYGFPYTFTNATLPAGINASMDVYVKVVAVALTGTTEFITSSTDWVKAASSIAPALNISQPKVDWALNLTTEFGGTGQPLGPAFNVSFDRKTDGAAPTLIYWINRSSHDLALDGANMTFVGAAAPLNNGASGTFAPRIVFNWTGTLHNQTASPVAKLPVGSYKWHVMIMDGTTKLAEGDRFFTILAAKPTVTVNEQALDVGVAKRGGSFYVAPTFEVPFTVNHGDANLTDVSQLTFKLVRGIVRTGQLPELTQGQEGFSVTVRPDTLDPSFTSSNFVAVVTLPPTGLSSGDPFQLNITAKIDVEPFRMGNAHTALSLIYDRQPPAGSLLVRETEVTVFDASTSNTIPLDFANPMPVIWGFAEDTGSGVKKVQVRLVDLTRNTTIRITSSGTGNTTVPGISEDWLDSSLEPTLITLSNDISNNGQRFWSIPLRNRAGLPDLWNANGLGTIDFTHKYRVDLYVTDNLTQRPSVFNSTMLDFDAAPPYLGYQNRLGTTSDMKSGLVASATTVSWHGSATIAVNVTDNQCIAAVRLVGFAESTPNATVKANMTPLTNLAENAPRRTCRENFPPIAGAPSPMMRYQIDLGTAPQMTDIVGNYTYWFEAEDALGQLTEVPLNFRTFKMQVVDTTPATLLGHYFDPNPGQAGGRTLIKADVFDNVGISHVDVQIRWANNTIISTARMHPENGTAVNGVVRYVADTQTDLNMTLAVHDYYVNITPFDVNWNRSTAAGGATCGTWCVGIFDIYRVVDSGGAPLVVLESPTNGATVNATPVFKFRALSRELAQSGVAVVAGVEGSEAVISATELNFTELTSLNGTRQGWAVTYAPSGLNDTANYSLNVTATVGGLANASAFKFLVDALPPEVTANVTGTTVIGNKTWAVAATRVALDAIDNVSATTTFYTVNGGSVQTYSGPITPAGNDGEWKLDYWAEDTAKNAAPHQSLSLSIDKTGPRIIVNKHGDEVLLTVTDAGVGLNESSVVIHYRYGETISYVTEVAQRVTGNSFSALLPGNASENGLKYYFTAQDLLGTQGSNFTEAAPYVIPKEGGTEPPPSNLPPTIRITKPTPAQSVRGTVAIQWLAEDPEGEPLTITIAIRDPSPGKLVSAGGDNTGSYTLNVADFPAQAYTLVLTASDGEKSASDTVTFNVLAGKNNITVVNTPPPTVIPNQPVNVGVSIQPAGTTVATATYTVTKDGLPYRTGQLTAGSGGNYGAAFTPTESGVYRVLVSVAYADGKEDKDVQVSQFSVGGGITQIKETTKVFPGSLIALSAMSALVVLLAAYGAFGRWRK